MKVIMLEPERRGIPAAFRIITDLEEKLIVPLVSTFLCVCVCVCVCVCAGARARACASVCVPHNHAA